MNPDVITAWLKSPATVPDEASVNKAALEWPWFIPLRVMEAAGEHQQSPFSEKALTKLGLYCSNWLPAYMLLQDAPGISAAVSSIEESNSSTAAVPADVAVTSTPDTVEVKPATPDRKAEKEQPLIQPLYSEDYFRHQGIAPEKHEAVQPGPEPAQQSQTLMVVMSFSEWLTHFKTKTQKDREEAQAKSALRSMWQQEKLAAALQDEPEEIPEDVFEMAVSSITREDDIASESLAQIYERQEKWSAAAEMYRKLALKYPAKSAYFATRAEAAKKRLL